MLDSTQKRYRIEKDIYNLSILDDIDLRYVCRVDFSHLDFATTIEQIRDIELCCKPLKDDEAVYRKLVVDFLETDSNLLVITTALATVVMDLNKPRRNGKQKKTTYKNKKPNTATSRFRGDLCP